MSQLGHQRVQRRVGAFVSQACHEIKPQNLVVQITVEIEQMCFDG
jgi:hypothetical protein